MTTAASDPAARNCFNVSRPSIPGSQTSSRMQPYARLPSAFRQSSPVATASATKPSSSITARSVSRMPRSSSTMRIESIYSHKKAQKLRKSGKIDYEFCTTRVVLFCADVTAVLQYNSLDDGQAETCAAVAPGEVRFEESSEIGGLDSLSRVSDLSPQQTSFRIVRRDDCELFFIAGGNHGFEGIVDQIYKHAFHLLDVEHGRGKIAIEVNRHPNTVEPFFIQTRSLCNNVVEICELRSRGGQTSKTRELIHHRLQARHFATDRFSTLRDHRCDSSIATAIRAPVTLRDPLG